MIYLSKKGLEHIKILRLKGPLNLFARFVNQTSSQASGNGRIQIDFDMILVPKWLPSGV